MNPPRPWWCAAELTAQAVTFAWFRATGRMVYTDTERRIARTLSVVYAVAGLATVVWWLW